MKPLENQVLLAELNQLKDEQQASLAGDLPNLSTLGPGSLAQTSPKMNPFPYQAHP